MISLIVLSLILMSLRYQPIDHMSLVIGQAQPMFLYTKAEHISSNRVVGPRGPFVGSRTSAPKKYI